MTSPHSDLPARPSPNPGRAGDDGALRRSLKNRHIQLIALGGAIGTGLFYGAGESISMAGPAILLAYLLGGLVIFLIMRALGEMSVDEPVSGAFSHYAHRYWGPFPGFVSGWNYWFNYIAVSMVELVVVGSYVQFWFPSVPLWVSSAVFLVLVTAVNLMSVKAFGEFEFWFAIVKVVAIVAMIVLGLAILLLGMGGDAGTTGVDNLWRHGGLFPHGVRGFLMSMVVVLFSFGGTELIGITAGEAEDPRRTIPRAINQVVLRILLFYVGAIFVMLTLYPWDQLGQDESPFVGIFQRLGIGSAATILNVVVLTAAVSAYNSGLYSNGRMLHALAQQGNAPAALARVSRAGSPWVAVLASSCCTAVAVLLNYLFPGKVFLYVISVATIAAIINWAMIMLTHHRFRQQRGEAARQQSFRLPLYPLSTVLVLTVLGGMVVLMALIPSYRVALVVGPVWVAVLSLAYAARRRTRQR